MLMRCKQVPRKGLRGASKGVALVEVVIAVLVLALLVGSVPAAMIAVSNAHFRANQIRIAENLTRNEFEYVKSHDYIWGNMTYPDYLEGVIMPVDVGFGVTVKAEPINKATGVAYTPYLDPADNVVKSQDDGIQLITVTVYGFGQRPEPSKTLLVSTNYKVAR
jgi:Tfp pilus assembly protein PilE